ncbi:outer membrane protein assembly factor BamB [Coralloluteibacterium stylophorae]|uniref:Outer membrane protein assembly factor BamB n=1 Tax=Coralloluteibacterium stylophorae TaxID=1776034 RepID=A0A8J7VTN4_9GAMM|nr:outer membrane protein assembly factor BamB [Coralloluteibacterium stylophorae]
MAVALALPGCSTIKGWFSSDDKDATAPAELTDITPTIEIRELWSQSIGDGEERLGLRQHPAVVDGAVYAADLEGRVRALDAQTGKEIWEIETEYQLSGGPGAGEGVVVVGGLNGDIVALDAATGSQRWHATTTSEVITAPAVAGGLAIVRSNDGRTSAYDLANGERRWTFDQQQLPSLTVRGNAEPVVANGIVYLGDAGGTVTALDLRTGLRRWEQVVAQPEGRTDLERMADVDGELAVSGSLLYAISFKGQALAMSSDSGAPLWNRDIGSYAGMAVTEQRVLAVDTHGTAWSLDRFGGSAMWRQEALARRWLTTPAIQGNYMVVGDYDGYLHWIDLDSGEIAARERLQGSAIRATPQVGADGTLYAISTDGKLAAYRID